MRIYEERSYSLDYKGKTYRINGTVAAVLASLDAQEDDVLSDYYKLETALDILLPEPHPVETALLEAVFSVLFPSKKEDAEPCIDFEMDAPLICAAFRQTYGIDMRKECTTMLWGDFVELLQGLPKSTRFMERVELRLMEVPKPTQWNAEYRAKLITAKAKVQIMKKGESKNKALWNLYRAISSMAGR